MHQFWIDRGGTFTDIVCRRPDGSLETVKLLSENPTHYKDAAVQGIRQCLGLAADKPIPAEAIEAVKMGTTVATNALLERKGDRTLLLINEGFGDLLRIGYQNRPRLFDLKITLPELLHARVAEIPGRLDAEGHEIAQLNIEKAREALSSAREDGIDSVAIAFMHSYLNPNHEARVAEIAAEFGIQQISVSHQVSPLIKLVYRADTTVIDAYLSPILGRYVEQVAEELGGKGRGQLLFMQSNGGLTDARFFRGKDAILSGPAGGVVGMVRTAGLAGLDKLIGFDMGGTSTDVCHYAGSLERSFETEVAGVRLRAPMMNIHTVAAGGGSILTFRDGRFQVGPDSAGAHPGPACYRQGGPLTVTDCNVMLGKIQPGHFPCVFGPTADQPLDAAIVREKFEALARAVAAATGAAPRSPEEIAQGFLRIAVENMANAIKKISVQRGYDVTDYTLQCFGGAGGQHACLVADALGMERVFIHPLAGVLSAYGMGLAETRALHERQFGQPISDLSAARSFLDDLSDMARAEVAAQGIHDAAIRTEERAKLRYRGADQVLEVAFGTDDEMRKRFDEAHRARFGFAFDDHDITIETLSVEAIGGGEDVPEREVKTAHGAAEPIDFVHMMGEQTRLYDRADLTSGQIIPGPCIIKEPTGTNVVEPGWQAEINRFGHLILTRAIPRERQEALGTQADPVMLEVFNNLFMSIAEQMGATLANTAYSVNIKERYDFSCAIFDARGDLVANAPHVPVHLGSMSESVRTILHQNAGRIRPGDVFMMNNPFDGGTHLPDVTVITPVFDEAGREIEFLAASRGHHADIGGKTPGSAPPDSAHIEEEGVLIDNFLLVEQGILREAETRALLASGRYPCRNIDQNLADLSAQIAANETGLRELHQMTRQFGRDVVQAYMGHVQANAAESVRRVLDVLKDCTFTKTLDSGSKIKVAIAIDRAARQARIDFSGTSEQDRLNYNAPFAVCQAVVLYVFRTLVGSEIPMNEGCLAPIEIHAPKGSMINPGYPAAVISGNTEVSQAIAEALFGALGVIAGSQGTMNNFVYGNARLQNYETICGGTGAGEGFDGASAVHSHMTNTRMTDPEVLESRFPVRVEEFSIRRGSGGFGRWRGGDGIRRSLTFLEQMTVTTLGSSRKVPPFGAEGGENGSTGRQWIERADGTVVEHAANGQNEVYPGDRFAIETPGGGGFGRVSEAE